MFVYKDRIWTTQGISSHNSEDGYFTTKRLKSKQIECTKLHICLITSLVITVAALVCVIPVYLLLPENVTENTELSDLSKYRLQVEAEILQWKKLNGTSMTIEKVTQQGYMMQEIVTKLSQMSNKNLTELEASESDQNMFQTLVQDICRTKTSCTAKVQSSPYRTIDGSCNNLGNPEWGMGGVRFRRDLPAEYADGIGTPRMYGVDGAPLPSPRTVSNIIHQPVRGDKQIDSNTTVMVMAFGQFLSHDIVSTPTSDGPHSSKLKCCDEKDNLSGPFKSCFNIQTDYTGEFFDYTKCMKFTRSAPAVCSDCRICGREQVNEISSYIDAGIVYGSTQARLQSLRKFDKGLLLVNETTNLLPWQHVPTCKGGRQEFCFAAGDARVTVVPNLSALHTIFVRLHNLMATELSMLNPEWGDETLFQETRKILIAITQNIVYSEYLPTILGPEVMKQYDLDIADDFRLVHDGLVNAAASNAFGTAAFRFGHATVPNEQKLLDVEYRTELTAKIEDTYNNPNMTVDSCSGLARWLVYHKGVVSDGMFGEGVRSKLFLERDQHLCFDLVALNIQRGRDHGLPGYNKWRQFCRLPVITETEFYKHGTAFGDFTVDVSNKFRLTYRHPDDIDLYSGGVRETVLPGSQVGPTFACILGDTFRRLRYGDRFFFENPYRLTGFTLDQLKTIKKLKLSKVICKTMGIARIPENVFVPSSDDEMVDCSDLEDVDLFFWMTNYRP
ncbi:heme binding [Mactra antiquata]